jgi:hypothetical protein
MKQFVLKIKPAINVLHRHRLSNLLEDLGYNVTGSGQMMDETECDISFKLVTDNKE